MMPPYTSEVQEQLIAALQTRQLTRLDFSQYDPDPPRYFAAAANIHSAALLSNDQMLVSSQYDNYIRVYNYQSGSGGGALRNLTGRAFCCAGLPNGHVICGDGNNLQVWDITKDQCMKTLTGDTGYVTSLAVLPNGQVVSYSKKDTLGRDGSCLYSTYYLAVWDVDTGQKILMSDIGGSGSESCLLAVLPNGQVVTTRYSNLYVWERSADKFLCLKQLQHSGGIKSIAVLSNGQVVTAGNHGLLQLWDVSTGQCLQTLAGHTDHVLCLAVLPNGQLVSGSSDNTVRIWDVSTGQCLKTVSRSVNHLWALPNGQVLSDDSSHRYNSNQFIRWTPFPRYCYGRIAPVLQAITPECGLQELSLGGVDLGQVGYAYLQELVQNVPSLQKLDLSDTDLTSGQIETLNQALQYHQAQHRLLQAQAKRIRQLEMQLSTTLAGEPYLKAQAQTKRDEQLQEQARQIRHLEIQLRRALQQANLETYLPSLTYSKVTFNCPVIEQTYHPIEDEAIPDEFLCPITRQIMWEPVMADDGYTYERDVIEAHFQRSVTSPMLPEEPLATQRLVMNRNVRAAIQRLLERHPEWVLHQPDAVYFSFAYEVTVQAAIVANDRAALLRAIDQEPRLLTRSLTQGMLIEQVWHQTELLEAVVQRLTPAMWSHMIQKEGSVSNWLAKLAKSALASQLQQFTVFLSALQAGLSCEYPTEALIAQGLHQSLPVLLLLGLDRLSGVNSSLDEQQNTALHYAAASGNLLLVTTLVEHGATIILKNKVGQTPKALAQLGGHDKVVAFCQQAKLQPFISQLLGNLGFLSQYQALREKVDQQQATMLHLEAQIQAQDQELQRLRGARSPSLCAVTPTGD